MKFTLVTVLGLLSMTLTVHAAETAKECFSDADAQMIIQAMDEASKSYSIDLRVASLYLRLQTAIPAGLRKNIENYGTQVRGKDRLDLEKSVVDALSAVSGSNDCESAGLGDRILWHCQRTYEPSVITDSIELNDGFGFVFARVSAKRELKLSSGATLSFSSSAYQGDRYGKNVSGQIAKKLRIDSVLQPKGLGTYGLTQEDSRALSAGDLVPMIQIVKRLQSNCFIKE